MERCKFKIVPLEHEDPSDYRSESYQEIVYRLSSARSGWPGARLAEHAAQSEERIYLIVRKRDIAIKIIRSPFMEEIEWSKLSAVLDQLSGELEREYPLKEGFDLIHGGPCGCLQAVVESGINWGDDYFYVPPELKIEALEID